MSRKRQALGESGEEIATKFLIHNNYTILAKNYRRKYGEIDIIAREGDYLVFVEVKMRTTTSHGHPLEAITLKKQKQISRVALCYLAENDLFDTAARFDVVSVLVTGKNKVSVELVPNAFDLC